MSSFNVPPRATLNTWRPLQIARIGSPRESASCAASNSQRSRSGFMSLLSTEGSATFWRKNSGEISEPPVSRRPSIFSSGTFRLSAFQTLISGCLPKLVRNRFLSIASGSPFRLSPTSDGMPELYRAIGRTVKISALAEGMIAASSNLATNLLLDFVGVEYARNVLRDAQVSGVELRRGVQDENAHERGIDNEVTADGLLTLLCAVRGDFLKQPSREEIIRILLAQRFNSMIPAGLPPHATVAHKTGEISTACHDAGIVYLPEREPYIVVILTEFDAEKDGRYQTLVGISNLIYRSLTGRGLGNQ